MAKINLTEEGFQKIKAELKELEETRRPAVVDRIQKARELGDLSENAEYTEAKEEQGFIEGRVAELKHMLNNSVIIPKGAAGDAVGLGSKIKVHTETEEEKEFIVVGAGEADPGIGKISDQSPIGRALLGKKIGETVQVQTPRGLTVYKILSIE